MAIGNRVANTTGVSNQRQKLWNSFRRHVFVLIHMAHQRLPVAEFQASEETDITGELAHKMREIVEAEDALDWMHLISIHDDPPQNTTPRKGKRRPRLDLEIERAGAGKRPRYAFEAKRLSKPNHHMGNYLGKTGYLGQEGLGMFISGIYAPNEPEAGMLGYIQTDDIDTWYAACLQRMKNINCEQRNIVDGLHTFCSKHQRKSTQAIDIFHLFLIFK